MFLPESYCSRGGRKQKKQAGTALESQKAGGAKGVHHLDASRTIDVAASTEATSLPHN
jgi:hypothetical protein